jgi:hypothetical protein
MVHFFFLNAIEARSPTLVLLDANLLAEISHTQKIAAVVISGKLLPKSPLQTMLAAVEAATNKKP